MKSKYVVFESILEKVCEKYKNQSILLSGGLDSSILAYHLKPNNAITIVLNKSFSDYYFSIKISKKFSINHYILYPSFFELMTNIKELIRIFKTFDPIFLRNSVIQFIGLKKAKHLGIKTIVLGDGSDELFAGYNFLTKYLNNLEQLKRRIRIIIHNMDFFSKKISEIVKIKIFLPFLEKEILSYEKNLKIGDKISTYKEQAYGKFFLRVCYENVLGKEIVWREKNALEQGSGTSNIFRYIDKELIDDEYFKTEVKRIKKEDKVMLRDKEHLYYYNYYRNIFEPPFKDVEKRNNEKELGKRICPYCNTVFIWFGNYCKLCGSYPVI